MRSWLVAPIVTNINDEYKRQLQTANHRHISTIVLISFLTVGLLILLAYIQKKRRQLASARNDLATLNSQLSAMNSELSSANTALSQTNEQLRHAISTSTTLTG
jgi:cell division protein FtsB